MNRVVLFAIIFVLYSCVGNKPKINTEPKSETKISEQIPKIEFNEKMNLAFKYPASNQTTDRKNLIDVILDAIASDVLIAYGFEDDEFIRPITLKEILSRGGARTDTIIMQHPEPPYEEYPAVVTTEFSRDKVVGYRVKEDWFFDKQRSVIDVRIIGIAPLIYAVDETGAIRDCLLYTSPSPRDRTRSRMPSSA